MQQSRIALFFILVLTSSVLHAQKISGSQETKWKQIVVLQSTRNDVERLLGKSRYQGHAVSYDLEDGHLNIEYTAFNFCEGGNNFGWSVPEWTVINVTFAPYRAPQFSALNLNLKQFRKVRENPCCPDLMTYVNDVEGVSYTTYLGGILNTIEYFPSSQYNHLRCRKQPKEGPVVNFD